MASSFSLPSESVTSFSLPQLKWSNTSKKTETTSALGFHRPDRIVVKFSSQGKNKTDDIVSSVADQNLVGKNGEESAKDETKEAEKRKRAFPTFSVSLGREKIEADVLAMSGSILSKRSTAKKKLMSLQNNFFQDHSSSLSSDNSCHSMGSRFNLVVEASQIKPTSSDGRRKITWKFTTGSQNKKNDNMVAINANDQTLTLTSTELENQKEVSNAVNRTLVAGESLPQESTKLGIATLAKDKGENFKKRTFSTFSVSLTKEEIEADFVAMGGCMRTRRIKKRPKNVQRQVDNLFPGLQLKYITPDDYRVREDKN